MKRRVPSTLRPGLRAAVLVVSGVLVVGAAIVVSGNVSDHLAQAAIHEAIRTTEAVVVPTVDPTMLETGMNGSSSTTAEIDALLVHLVRDGRILRIKIWSRDGTVLYSDLPQIRGAHFGVDDDLGTALAGQIATGIDDGNSNAPENQFDHGLAARLLSIYIPIRSPDGATVLGAYEIYEDAAPIEADIAATRQDVLLIVGAMALALLAMLYGAFSVTSRLLSRQNRRLRDQAVTEQLLITDLRRSEERFRSLVRNSVDVHVILTADGTITYESPAVERVLGHPASERLGQCIVETIHPDDRSRLEGLLAAASRTPGAEVSSEVRARHADGSWRSLELVVKNLLDDPSVGGVVVNYRDVTARKSLEDELRHQAFHDALTGLANRALFTDRLEHALSRTRRSRHRMAVLFLDLDDFKTINDSLGHGEGDALLVAVAERLQDAVRAGDTIARMGGDEFGILLEEPIDVTPVEIAQRLQASLEAPFRRHGKDRFVRASVGVAVARSAKTTPGELLRNADAAMYMAKSRGKNRVELFQPSMHTAAVARLALSGDLERAMDRGEFELLYQPIVQLMTREIIGVEALIRWRHPARGLVGPNDFIPIAEETGLIVPLGSWVLEQACRQAGRWDVVGSRRALSVSVNVSGRQVVEPSFVSDVADVLDRTGLAPQRLVLEFTEGVLMRDTELTTSTLDRLKRLGVRLSIDDFGTGFSSLNYLRLFPIDVLKIDGSFVAGLAKGPEQKAVVRTILRLGQSLRLDTVAEGIEDAGQLADLRALGAIYGQGYFFARPLNADEITVMLGSELEQQSRLSVDRFVA